jgi:hypothetical protein
MESGSPVEASVEGPSEDSRRVRGGNGEECAVLTGAKYVLMFGLWCCCDLLAAADAALTKRLCQAVGQYAFVSGI